MKLEELLESLPVDQWQVAQVYNFDWHDGPREGVCSLTAPGGEFCFELLEERYNPDGLDYRLFRLSELPNGSVEEVLSAVPDLASSSEPVRRRAEQRLQMIRAKRRLTPLVVLTQDMIHFLGYWRIEGVQGADVDWFSALGIAHEKPA